ncbi:hypothetical protein [Dactylosporangium sp. NPDC051484]|uniref:hypothetical protein n=1 Tax=Dactylosporangium sp. NPDC051484 TaxID=3154942 RepID=UPI00344E0A94
MGHPAPIQQFVARAAHAVVALQHFVAFREGCTFALHIAARRGPLEQSAWERLLGSLTGQHPYATPTDAALAFGVRFPDGSTATTIANAFRGREHPTDRPDPPMLIETGGGSSSSDRSYQGDQQLWLWPLPPPEPFEFVIEWPSMGIGTIATTLDGSAIARAAEQAQPYWP